MSNPISSTHRFRKPKIILALLSLVLCASLVAAAVFTMFYTSNTATVKIADVRLGAGPDGAGGPTYPNASVTVAPTNDSATVAFSIFPSAGGSPAPASYYTNLLNITNVGSLSHTIKAITVTALSGESNLGSLTIYYYAAQTDTPDTGSPIGSGTLTSVSSPPVSVFSGTQSIAAGATQYIEIVAYADDEAAEDSTVTFTVSIQWV